MFEMTTFEAEGLDKAALLQENKYNAYYLSNGYQLTESVSRNREAAKDEAKRLRAEEGKLAVYTTLLEGWFGVFAREADEKEAREVKAPKPVVETTFEFEGIRITGNTKQLRRLAVALVEHCRNAEYAADRAAANKS